MTKPNKIALARPSFDDRELQAVKRVLDSGWVVQGPEVAAFEENLTSLQQVKNCIAVSSGTAALHICYLALGIGPGDAVFIPSFAWPSAANMALQVGARPVFVDVLPGTYNIDPANFEKQIQLCRDNDWGMPKAVVPVHEFGLATDLDEIIRIAKKHDLIIIEDAACALGATYKNKPVGIYGRIGIFSFHPRKAITLGEGGAIVTDDDRLAENCRMWRNHGQTIIDGQRDFALPGLNYRMTEIQAAIGRIQLEKFPAILKKRKEIADYYLRHLTPGDSYTLPASSLEHTWQTFMIVLENHLQRTEVIRLMTDLNVETGPGSMSGHCLKLYHDRFGYKNDDLPVSRRLHDCGLALPLHGSLSPDDCARVCRSLDSVLSSTGVGTA